MIELDYECQLPIGIVNLEKRLFEDSFLRNTLWGYAPVKQVSWGGVGALNIALVIIVLVIPGIILIEAAVSIGQSVNWTCLDLPLLVGILERFSSRGLL